MKSIIVNGAKWFWTRIDTLMALGTALAFSVAGFMGRVTGDKLSSATLATLTLLAFILLRERHARNLIQHEVTKFRQTTAGLKEQIENSLISNDIQVIPPTQIQQDFASAMLRTEYWDYKGGCGTFLRAVTLPAMANNARAAKLPRAINIQIINPSDLEVCQSYSRFRRGVQQRTERSLGDWSVDHVRTEAYATVLAGCIFSAKHDLLEIKIGLLNYMSIYRYDRSSDHVIITQEDKAAPALKALYGTHYYDAHKHEMLLSMRQARLLDLQGVEEKCKGKVTPDVAKMIFTDLEIGDDKFISELHLANIIEKAEKAVNPYG